MNILDQLADLAPWHFDILLEGGIRTIDGNKPDYENSDFDGVQTICPDEMRPLFHRLLGEGFDRRSFLDVGCNAGGYCFVAAEMGAGRVLGFDVRDHWINQARFVQQHGTTKGREDIEFRVCSLHDLGRDEKFDVTLFKGVFYHLPDPIHALLSLCDLTEQLIIVDSATMSHAPEGALVSEWESKSKVMSGVDGLCWYPGGPAALMGILRYAGFTEAETVHWHKETNVIAGRGRCRVVAARSRDLLARYRDRA